MMNFGIIQPTGGQPRPLSAFMQDRQQEHDAAVRDQTQQMQLQDAYQQHADRAALRDIVSRSGGDWNKAATDAAAAGVDPQSLMALQDRARGEEDRQRTLKERGLADTDRARKEAVDKMGVASKVSDMIEGVNDPATYAQYRQQAGEIAKQYGIPFDMPETYDPKYVEQKKTAVRALHQAWTTLTAAQERQMGLDESGTYQVNKSGEMKTIVKPASNMKSVEQWSAMAPQEAQAAGFPAGSVIYRSTRGKPLAAYTPKGGAGGEAKPTNSGKEYQEMLKLGVPEDVAQATAYGTYRQVRNMVGDVALVDVASGQSVGALEPDPNNKGKVIWVPAQPAAAPAAGGGALPPAAAQQLQEGHVTTFGNGQQWTLQGGKQVRVK